jgi:hypothetical protein
MQIAQSGPKSANRTGAGVIGSGRIIGVDRDADTAETAAN